MKVDEDFNELTLKDIKILIAKAFIGLEAKMRFNLSERLDKELTDIVENKACQMKKELCDFIDTQVKNIKETSNNL